MSNDESSDSEPQKINVELPEIQPIVKKTKRKYTLTKEKIEQNREIAKNREEKRRVEKAKLAEYQRREKEGSLLKSEVEKLMSDKFRDLEHKLDKMKITAPEVPRLQVISEDEGYSSGGSEKRRNARFETRYVNVPRGSSRFS